MMFTIRSYAKLVYLKTLNAALLLSAIFYKGKRFSCPVCGWKFRKMRAFKGHFYIKCTMVDHYTPNAICPRCNSDIRHRFVLNYLKANPGILTSNIKMLHFAPEVHLSSYLEKLRNIEYVKCDIDPANFPGAIKVDITNIPLEDATFDAVICIHVLEHIKNDTRAIREVYRILKPGAWALMVIPVYGDTTFEIKDLSSEDRKKMYGTDEHMRMNGLDFEYKLSNAGFKVDVVSFDDVPGEYMDRTVKSPHIESDRYLFFCRK